MSNYTCNICNYQTDRYNNFIRHTNSSLHLKRCHGKQVENSINASNNIIAQNSEINELSTVANVANVVTNNPCVNVVNPVNYESGKHQMSNFENVDGLTFFIKNLTNIASIVDTLSHLQKPQNNTNQNNILCQPINTFPNQVMPQQNNIQCIDNSTNLKPKKSKKFDIYVCKFCGKQYDNRSSKYQHQKKCGELHGFNNKSCSDDESSEEEYEDLTKSEIQKKLKEKTQEIKSKDKQLKRQENQINQLLQTNVNATATSANVSESTNKSMNMMTYAMKYFKDAPVLKQLEKSQVKELVNYIGTLKSYEDVSNYVKTLLRHFKKQTIIPYFGKMIGTYLGVNVPVKKRRVWTTDASRLSFIVMQYVNRTKEKEWSTDKSGRKFISMVIDPMLKFINELLRKYLKFEEDKQTEYYKSFEENRLLCERIMELRGETLELQQELSNDSFKTSILKYIAPYFNFDYTKNKEPKEIDDLNDKIFFSAHQTKLKVTKINSDEISDFSIESTDEDKKKYKSDSSLSITSSSEESKYTKITKSTNIINKRKQTSDSSISTIEERKPKKVIKEK